MKLVTRDNLESPLPGNGDRTNCHGQVISGRAGIGQRG